jgi:hypothetical protein
MRDCPEDRLVLLVNGRLKGIAHWRTERHVKTCTTCQATVTELKSLSQGLLSLTTETPSIALTRQIPTPRLVPQNNAVNRALRALPAVGMALGLLLTLGLHTFGQTSTASQYLAYKLPHTEMSTAQIDTMRDLGPGAESLHNKRSKIGQASMGSEGYERVELIVEERDPQQAEQELKDWVARIQESQPLKAQKCEVWPLTPRKVMPAFAEQGLLMLLGIGIGLGFLAGVALAGCIWLARTVPISYVLPVIGAVLGTVIGAYASTGSRAQPAAPRQTYGVRANLWLTWKGPTPLGRADRELLTDTLVALRPNGNAPELRIDTQYGLSFPTFSQEYHRFEGTLDVSGHWTPESASQTMRHWQAAISRAFPQAEILHGVVEPVIDPHVNSPVKTTPWPLTGALYGLAIGVGLVLLMRLGSMIPGGTIGCIVTGGLIGVIALGLAKVQAPRYIGSGTLVVVGRCPSKSALEQISNRYWPRDANYTRTRVFVRGNELSFIGYAKDPKIGEKWIQEWMQTVRDAPEFKLLGLKVEKSEKVVVHPFRTYWGDMSYTVFLGLAVGLFMGLTRRR